MRSDFSWLGLNQRNSLRLTPMDNFKIPGSIAFSSDQAQGILFFLLFSMCITFILIAYKKFSQLELPNHSPPIGGLNEAKIHWDM